MFKIQKRFLMVHFILIVYFNRPLLIFFYFVKCKCVPHFNYFLVQL